VLIEVIEGTTKPYSVNNQSFIRSGSETRPADDNEMSNLIRARRKEEYSWENSPALEATLEDLDREEISQAIELSNNIGRTTRFKTDDPLTFLTHFQLFRNNQFTNSAIVLFGKEPTYFLPQCRIRIIHLERVNRLVNMPIPCWLKKTCLNRSEEFKTTSGRIAYSK